MSKLNLKTASQEDIAWEKERLAAEQQKDLKNLGIGLIVISLMFVISVALMLFHIWIIPAQRLELIQCGFGVMSGVLLLMLCSDFLKREVPSKWKGIFFGVCGAIILGTIVAVYGIPAIMDMVTKPQEQTISSDISMVQATEVPATVLHGGY